MKPSLAFALGGFAVIACTPQTTYLTVTPQPVSAEAGRLSEMPGFIIVPALDRRPLVEREGRHAEVGFLFASTGGSMGHSSGVLVVDIDERLRWPAHAFHGQPQSVATAVASDVGRALEAAAGRPSMFVTSAADVLAKADDGAVIVTVVIDHIAELIPSNADFSQTRTQHGNYEVTTTRASNDSFGPFWTFSFQIEIGEVRGHQVTRHLVRHAAAASISPTSYSDAIHQAASQVVEAVAREWGIVKVVPAFLAPWTAHPPVRR